MLGSGSIWLEFYSLRGGNPGAWMAGLSVQFTVDVFVPGCPPSADLIHFVVSELVEGREPDLKGKLKYG